MKYLIFGGSGALGKVLIKRLLDMGNNEIFTMSRDEEKKRKLHELFPFIACTIGDIRDYSTVERYIRLVNPDFIINAAAMKQVPACETYISEAVKTNVDGAINLVRAVEYLYPAKKPRLDYIPHLKVLSISTDKAVKPVNSYGATKMLQERIHLNGCADAVFSCVRYGNCLESTGSVIPIFRSCISNGQILKITHLDMTRFLLNLERAVDLILKSLGLGFGGTLIPAIPSAKIVDLADILIEKYGKNTQKEIVGIREGEKINEVLISEDELYRTFQIDEQTFMVRHFVHHEREKNLPTSKLIKEYSSADLVMNKQDLKDFLLKNKII